MRAFGQFPGGRFGEKSSRRERGVVRRGAVEAWVREGRGDLDFRALWPRARRRSSVTATSEPVSEELRPLRGAVGKADPTPEGNPPGTRVGGVDRSVGLRIEGKLH